MDLGLGIWCRGCFSLSEVKWSAESESFMRDSTVFLTILAYLPDTVADSADSSFEEESDYPRKVHLDP